MIAVANLLQIQRPRIHMLLIHPCHHPTLPRQRQVTNRKPHHHEYAFPRIHCRQHNQMDGLDTSNDISDSEVLIHAVKVLSVNKQCSEEVKR